MGNKKQPDEPKQEDSEEVSSIPDEIRTFVHDIESLYRTLPLTMVGIGASHVIAKKEHDEFLQKHGKRVNEKDRISGWKINIEHLSEVERLAHTLESSVLASHLVPKSFLVALVSQYDSYLGRLIRTLFYLRPEILSQSERKLEFAELIKFTSMTEAREYVIEKEVEGVIRQSHTEQFAWLERKFSILLRKELLEWPTFVELTERRNLFVHCNGVVSSQYLSVCRSNGNTPETECRIGSKLAVSAEYFDKAYRCLFQIGVKLGQVLWRKLCPEDIEAADDHLIDIAYSLLLEEDYSLACLILQFATQTLKKHSNEAIRLVLVINTAIAYKYLNQEKEWKELLGSEDWSAADSNFQLAVHVLRDEFEDAAKLMLRIGRNGEMRKEHYKEWPLFKSFRSTELFQRTYEKVFGEPFLIAKRTSATGFDGFDEIYKDFFKRKDAPTEEPARAPKPGHRSAEVLRKAAEKRKIKKTKAN